MAGPFDKITAALNGHTTSGMDAALSAHADEIHPVNRANPDTKITKSTDTFAKPIVKPAGGYALKLPGDSQ